MLVLTRKRNESLWIGDTRIMLSSLSHGKVRLCIVAPPHVHVRRDELGDTQPHGGARDVLIGRLNAACAAIHKGRLRDAIDLLRQVMAALEEESQ